MKCPVCENDSRVFDPEMHLYRCDHCRHRFTKLPKDMQEKYDDSYFEGNHSNWFENPDFKLFEKVEGAIGKAGKNKGVHLLDVGCGRGDFLKWIHGRRPDWNLTGIDLAPNSHEGIRFIQGDVCTLQLKEKYDVITAFMVVEHLEEIGPFFSQMRKLLNPDGLFVVNTFNDDSLMFRLARLLKKIGIQAAYERLYSRHHLQHYSKESIRKIIHLSGFEILEHRCHNYPLKAVDTPRAGKFIELMYKGFVGLVFLLSDPLNQGIEHTLICRPASN